MARPPSYPPLGPPTPGFPSSTTIQEEGSASVEQTAKIRVRHSTVPSAGASSALRCDFFAPHVGQTTLDTTWYKETFIEAKKAMGNFWYFSIPFNLANSPYWKHIVATIATCGARFKAPTYHDLKGPILDDVVSNIKKVIEEQGKSYKKRVAAFSMMVGMIRPEEIC